jgi:hypothetical protein
MRAARAASGLHSVTPPPGGGAERIVCGGSPWSRQLRQATGECRVRRAASLEPFRAEGVARIDLA